MNNIEKKFKHGANNGLNMSAVRNPALFTQQHCIRDTSGEEKQKATEKDVEADRRERSEGQGTDP